MEYLALALVATTLIFFASSGKEMIENVFKHKADAARERRLEAEARVEEARLRARDDARDRL